MAIRCLGIIPSCFSSSEKADDNKMLDFFKNDTNFDSVVKTELQLWRAYFKGKELPETAQSSLQHANPLVFPNIRINTLVRDSRKHGMRNNGIAE